MEFLDLIHAAVTFALCGLIWTVQLALYPLFRHVGEGEFPRYHAAHMRGIALVVAPLMLVELATAGWLLVAGERDPVFVASVALVVVNWGSTALVQVPQHRRLEKGRDLETCRRLVWGNWVRTGAWSARAVLVAIWWIGR